MKKQKETKMEKDYGVDEPTVEVAMTGAKQPLGFAWSEDSVVTLTGKEFSALTLGLREFEEENKTVLNCITVRNLIQQRHINEGIFKPFYQSDIDEKGNLKENWGK
jgi:hypothetical protein